MKNLIIGFALLTIGKFSIAQTNTFPANGNVGVGLLNPLQKFTIKSSGALVGVSSADYDFGITDGATYPLQLLSLVNTSGNYGLVQVIKGGVGASNLVMQTQGGNVGIGKTAPASKMHIYENNTSTGNSNGITIEQGGTGDAVQHFLLSGNQRWSMGIDNSDAYSFKIGTNADLGAENMLTIQKTGNVGIGITDAKGYKLAVNGNIRTKEIKVEATNWPDYVFSKNYSLPSLENIEKHIRKEGYLPDIPSAAEVEKNGVNLGEMNAKLLKKIEELTLYIINQNKQLSNQQTQLNKISQDNLLLKRAIYGKKNRTNK